MANAADPQKIKDQERRSKDARERKLVNLQWVMSDKRGREFIAELLDFCGPLRTPWDPNGSKANFNMGQQNVGLKLFADLEAACPDLSLVMRQESKKQEDDNA